MSIQYLTGPRFYYAVLAGGEAIIDNQSYLNKINVFPVPDADTGTNLAATMMSILNMSEIHNDFSDTIDSIANSAIRGARGNSGIIFAQFLHGLSAEMIEKEKVTVEHFANACSKAVYYIYEAIVEPVEGTMITVIKDWAASLKKHSTLTSDFSELFSKSLNDARVSLKNTPKKLKILADAGVVDAGAKGFVHFLEGISNFIAKGRTILNNKREIVNYDSAPLHDLPLDITFRYCSEANLSDVKLSISQIRDMIKSMGDSLIIAGSSNNMHLHMHTNNPEVLFAKLKEIARINNLKIDDMKKQFDLTHNRKYDIGLITDSACDLPGNFIDKEQISEISFGVNIDDNYYLDKKTLLSNQFYDLIKDSKVTAKTSQPSRQRIESIYSFTKTHFKHVIGLHISDKLTGIYQYAQSVSKDLDNENIAVFNTKQLTVSEGLIVKRTADAIASGKSFEEIKQSIPKWIKNTKIFVDVATLKYMLRGGRVPKFSGYFAEFVGIKPIISLDENGKADVLGKSFGRNNNQKKIIKLFEEFVRKNGLWNYAIVHADALTRAQDYARKIEKAIGVKPAYISDLSPVVGVHNGVGAVAVGIMGEQDD